MQANPCFSLFSETTQNHENSYSCWRATSKVLRLTHDGFYVTINKMYLCGFTDIRVCWFILCYEHFQKHTKQTRQANNRLLLTFLMCQSHPNHFTPHPKEHYTTKNCHQIARASQKQYLKLQLSSPVSLLCCLGVLVCCHCYVVIAMLSFVWHGPH